MLITDPVSDMIIRIFNAYQSEHETVMIPHSRMKEAIAKILTDNKYVESYDINEKKPQSEIIIKLRYVDQVSSITGVKRVSKPGRRLYTAADKIPVTLGGYGITILSTNKGVITGKKARKQNVGGEILCKIW